MHDQALCCDKSQTDKERSRNEQGKAPFIKRYNNTYTFFKSPIQIRSISFQFRSPNKRKQDKNSLTHLLLLFDRSAPHKALDLTAAKHQESAPNRLNLSFSKCLAVCWLFVLLSSRRSPVRNLHCQIPLYFANDRKEASDQHVVAGLFALCGFLNSPRFHPCYNSLERRINFSKYQENS